MVHEAETAVDRTGVDFSIETLVKVGSGLEPDGDFEQTSLSVFVVRREVKDVSLRGRVEAVAAAGSEGDCPCGLAMGGQIDL